MTPPTIPRPLARRIDRLSRRAHAFHRYAHHPLCVPYRHEVIRLGRHLRVCKGCTYLGAGFVLGFALGAVAQPSLTWGCLGLALSVVAGIASLKVRLPKVAGRAWPGAGIGLGLWAGWPCALASTLLVGTFGILYRRRGSQHAACETCHERQRQPCSGFVLIMRRERAFQRKAQRWLASYQADGSERGLSHAKKHG